MSDAAIVTIVTGVVTIATLWIKIVYGVEKKVDENTKLTKDGTQKAAENASEATKSAVSAAETAGHTKVVADGIARKLNGGIDEAIAQAVAPLRAKLEENAQGVLEMREDFKKLAEYVHQRNHDVLNALSAQYNKVSLLIAKADQDTK